MTISVVLDEWDLQRDTMILQDLRSCDADGRRKRAILGAYDCRTRPPPCRPAPSTPAAPTSASLGVHALPLDLSTTYPLPDIEKGGDAYEQLATGGAPRSGDSHVYARLWNPTVARFEEGIADLEQAGGAVAFGTGMAALTAVLLGLGEGSDPDGPRPHVVAVRPMYGGSDHLLAAGVCGTSVTFTDPARTAEDVAGAVAEAARPTTRLVMLETPSNPTLDLVDIAAVVKAAREHCPDAVVMVDNTFATPVLQRPLTLGADLVLHSATKFIGGHGDAMGGVVAVGGEHADAWTERLRRVRAITGALLHPFGAYLLHRGLATLPLRVAPAGRQRPQGRARPGPAPRDRGGPLPRPGRRGPHRTRRHPDGGSRLGARVPGGGWLRGRVHGGRRGRADHARGLTGWRRHPDPAPRGTDPPSGGR